MSGRFAEIGGPHLRIVQQGGRFAVERDHAGLRPAVRAPIGLRIGARSPEEVAVAIAAELVQATGGRGREPERVAQPD